MLSDTAKRLLYRDRELDLLRMMVEQDIAAGDHESALRLVDELSEHFGRLEEAEAHRTRIGSLRRAEVETRIEEEMRSIRRLLEAGDWSGATRAAERFQRVLPDAPGAEDLVRQVAAARRRHSIELESRMRDAHADGRIDEAMTLLRDLDRHLEGEEAPGTKSMLQARITPESIRLSTDRLVVSLRPRVEDGTLVLVPASGTRIGRLPVPTALFRGFVDSIDLDALLERLPASEGPAPEAAGAVRLGATFPLGDGRAVELLEVQLQSSEAVLVFRTVRDGAVGETRD